jgi:hypothetical protein
MVQQVTSIDQLKEMIANHVHDYFIRLNGGFRSSKNLDYVPDEDKFIIFNEIDGSEQELDEQQLMDRDYTNVGYAITVGALYSY